MPSYSFKERFVPFVKDFTKRQTVRAYRKDGKLPKVGEPAHLFWGMRTVHCTRLLPAQTITEAKTIFIFESGNVFITNLVSKVAAEFDLDRPAVKEKRMLKNFLSCMLLHEEKDLFAWKDGFKPEGTTLKNPAGAFDLMIRFWKQTHQLPFTGTVTYW